MCRRITINETVKLTQHKSNPTYPQVKKGPPTNPALKEQGLKPQLEKLTWRNKIVERYTHFSDVLQNVECKVCVQIRNKQAGKCTRTKQKLYIYAAHH